MAKQIFVIPAAWAGRNIEILSAKKCVPGKFAEQKWNLISKMGGEPVENYLKLDEKMKMDKPNWARAEIRHFLERGHIKLVLPALPAPGHATQLIEVLKEIRDELRNMKEELNRIAQRMSS